MRHRYAMYLYAVVVLLTLTKTTNANSQSYDNMGCGEQCVRVIATFFELDLSGVNIRKYLSPGLKGESSLTDLVNCLQQLGLYAIVVQGSFEELMTPGKIMILHQKPKESSVGHFVVAKPLDSGYEMIIADPSNERLPFTASAEELAPSWTGFAVLVSTSPFDTAKKTNMIPALIGCGVIMLCITVTLLRERARSLSQNVEPG